MRRCFRDGFSQKGANSAKFPAFFPTTREFWPSRDCEISIHGKPPRRLPSSAGHARKARIKLANPGGHGAARRLTRREISSTRLPTHRRAPRHDRGRMPSENDPPDDEPAILVGGAIGWGLDWALKTKPAFTIVFFLLGVVAGVWNVIRATSPKGAPPVT